jgi:hypothetical protein
VGVTALKIHNDITALFTPALKTLMKIRNEEYQIIKLKKLNQKADFRSTDP